MVPIAAGSAHRADGIEFDYRSVSMLNRIGYSLAAALISMLLPACTLLPGVGPTSDAVNNNATAGLESSTPLPYALVDVTADTIGPLSQPNLITFKGEFPDKGPKPTTQVIGVGDVLNITVFEAAPGGLFTPAQAAGARPGNFVGLPVQAVDQNGNIRVPYAGAIPAAGKTIPEIEDTIVARLRKRAIEPQVVISLSEQHASVVSVLGDVTTPGVQPINSSGERLLAMIAHAGGPKFEAIETYVTLQRAGKRVKVLLSHVVKDPRENIFVRPNDVIFLSHEAPTFTAFGALNQSSQTTTITNSETSGTSSTNSEIAFDVETLTLAQALGKTGGLSDSQSDPAQVYIFRYEERPFLEKLGVDISPFAADRIPTIYHVNLRDPSGILLAASFQMQSKDVIYIANAPVVDYYKLLTLINNTAIVSGNTATAVTTLNAAAKTKW